MLDEILCTTQQHKRNQSMECCKFIAAFMVVFIHTQFPNSLGGAIACVCRCAVPLFFSISGYFSFGLNTKKIEKRIQHIIKLNFIGILVELIGGAILSAYAGESVIAHWRTLFPDRRRLAIWLILSENPFGLHLWYLMGILVCYIILRVYVGFWGKETVNYKYLYLAGICLFAINLANGEYSVAAEIPMSNLLCRNALFLGLPMFAMGLFLREYWIQIWNNYQLTLKKLIKLILGGTLLAIIEWRGIGPSDVHVGTVITVVAILLLTIQYPQIVSEHKLIIALLSKMGNISTIIYIIHPTVIDFYNIFVSPALRTIIGNSELYLIPFAVFGLSMFIAVLWEYIIYLKKRFLLKR